MIQMHFYDKSSNSMTVTLSNNFLTEDTVKNFSQILRICTIPIFRILSNRRIISVHDDKLQRNDVSSAVNLSKAHTFRQKTFLKQRMNFTDTRATVLLTHDDNDKIETSKLAACCCSSWYMGQTDRRTDGHRTVTQSLLQSMWAASARRTDCVDSRRKQWSWDGDADQRSSVTTEYRQGHAGTRRQGDQHAHPQTATQTSVTQMHSSTALYDRHNTRCYFNVYSKAHMSPLNLPHGTNN